MSSCHDLPLQQKIELINELESKLTDVYIDSKTKKQTTLEDCFKQN
jgi:hypothetical protein